VIGRVGLVASEQYTAEEAHNQSQRYAIEDKPYLRPTKREKRVKIMLKRIDSMIDVAKGMMQVRFFPWITMSPGSLPKGMFTRDAR
jgi:hypothetical protein